MKKNIDFKQINKFGCTIFHEAAKCNNTETIKLIAETYIEKNSKEEFLKFLKTAASSCHQTALHYAAQFGSSEVLNCFIDMFDSDEDKNDDN